MNRLDLDQQEALLPFVGDQVIHDLGAGNLVHAHDLILMGAKRVVAVDRNMMPMPSFVDRIELRHGYFHDFHDPVDVAFMSWPINHDCGLTEIAQRSRVVIYIGKNSDGSACGTPTFFRYLARREILVHAPAMPNVLIVYGPEHRDRPLLPEEFAAIYQERCWSYDELMAERWTSRWARLYWGET